MELSHVGELNRMRIGGPNTVAVNVNTMGWDYPNAMVAAIRVYLDERRTALLARLEQLGVDTGTTEPTPEPEEQHA